MKKNAITDYSIHELVAQRWSPVSFADRSITSTQVRQLLEAARWAASCYNAQPWHFLVAHRDDASNFTKLLECLLPANREWAKRAAVLMITVARDDFPHNSKPNGYGWHDVGLATGNLMAQATAQGLVVHAMAGFDADAARSACAIPSGFSLVSALAVGWPGDPSDQAEPLRQRDAAPRERRPQREWAFTVTWNHPYDQE